MSDKPEISNAEFEVLDVLWDDHPATSNEVIARLNDKKDWQKNRQNLVRPLAKKVLGFEKQQRQYLYYPLIAKEDYTKKKPQFC